MPKPLELRSWRCGPFHPPVQLRSSRQRFDCDSLVIVRAATLTQPVTDGPVVAGVVAVSAAPVVAGMLLNVLILTMAPSPGWRSTPGRALVLVIGGVGEGDQLAQTVIT